MNIFTTQNIAAGRFIAVLTAFSMILSALPVHFFVAFGATPDTLFSNGFEEGDFSAWDGAGAKWSTVNNAPGAHSGTYRAKAVGPSDGSVLIKAVSTAGYQNITVSFWYKLAGLESGDVIEVDYSADGGATWLNDIVLFSDGNGDDLDTWTKYSAVLSTPAENNTDFKLRFRIETDAEGDEFNLDDVEITGDIIEVEVPGCTDDSATNYDENATEDDGSCEYEDDLSSVTICKYDDEQNPLPGWSVFLKQGEIIYSDVTGDLDSDNPGCVVINNWSEQNGKIPYGTYTLGETMQDGWENVSGDGEVVEVDEPTESFMLVNREVNDEVPGCDDLQAFTFNQEDDDDDCEPTPEECEDEMPAWAFDDIEFNPGLKKDGSTITDPERTDPVKALGPADWSAGGSTGFVSLGFGGSIVVSFENYVVDVDGDDLSIHEATNGTYPVEKAKIEVSQTGNNGDWHLLAEEARNDNNEGGDNVTLVDFSATGLDWIQFVRITDTSDAALFANIPNADGYDLDAVDATKAVCDKPNEPEDPTGKIKIFKWIKGEDKGPASLADFSFQIDGNGPVKNFNEFGFAYVELPIGETYTVNEIEIPDNYDHVITICKVINYNHDKLKIVSDDSEGWDSHFPQWENWNSFNTVTLDDEGDKGICLIVNKYDEPDEPLVCRPDVNLIANGGFESPEVTNGAGWDIFAEGVAGLAWLVDWVSPNGDATDPASLELHAGVNGWNPASGEQYAELDGDYEGPGGGNGEPASTKITQNIPTIPGETYTLSWDFSPRPDTQSIENELVVSVNGTDEVVNTGVGAGNTNWSSHSYSFEATGNSTEIAFKDGGTPNSVGTFVDNVSLVCAPGPTVGEYCGDGEVNQEWEMCDGGQGCTDMCTFENQCSDLQLVKITLSDDAPDSVSFDGNIYLGNDTNEIPNGTWFLFGETGDDNAKTTAMNVEGLAVQRTANGLNLAVEGDNARNKFDYVQGEIEFFNLDVNSLVRTLGGGWALENPSKENGDIFKKDDDKVVFEWYLTTGNDAAAVKLSPDAEMCENGGGNGDKNVIDGYKWNDLDGDGVWDGVENDDALEPAIEGWTIYATQGETELETQTDENGYYKFMVEDGEWIITEEEPEGWTQTFPGDSGSCLFNFGDDSQNDSLLDKIIETFISEETNYHEGECNFGNQENEGGNNGDYTLTVTITGEGSGIVESTDTLISCETNGSSTLCVHTYTPGSVVDLTATPDEGSNFDNSWTTGAGTCTGNNTPCQVTMTSDIDLVAHFDLDGGSSSGGGGGGGISRSSGSSGSGSSNNNSPTPQVLGEQVSLVPQGAPDTGAGGSSNVTFATLPFMLALLNRRVEVNAK